MDNGRPVPIRVHTIVISTQHSEDITQEEIQVSSPLLLPRQCGHMLPFLLMNDIETTFGACDQARGARGVLGRQNRLPLEPLGTYIHTYIHRWALTCPIVITFRVASSSEARTAMPVWLAERSSSTPMAAGEPTAEEPSPERTLPRLG